MEYLQYRFAVLNFSVNQNHLEDLLKHKLPGITTRASDSAFLGETQEFAFLISCQVMLMMLT